MFLRDRDRGTAALSVIDLNAKSTIYLQEDEYI